MNIVGTLYAGAVAVGKNAIPFVCAAGKACLKTATGDFAGAGETLVNAGADLAADFHKGVEDAKNTKLKQRTDLSKFPIDLF